MDLSSRLDFPPSAYLPLLTAHPLLPAVVAVLHVLGTPSHILARNRALLAHLVDARFGLNTRFARGSQRLAATGKQRAHADARVHVVVVVVARNEAFGECGGEQEQGGEDGEDVHFCLQR
jgi:hypothetical protein